MPYVTSVERIAKEEGIKQGIVLTVLRQLKRPCGPIPEDVQQAVHELPLDQLQLLVEAIFDIQSVEDLKTWLKSSKH